MFFIFIIIQKVLSIESANVAILLSDLNAVLTISNSGRKIASHTDHFNHDNLGQRPVPFRSDHKHLPCYFQDCNP